MGRLALHLAGVLLPLQAKPEEARQRDAVVFFVVLADGRVREVPEGFLAERGGERVWDVADYGSDLQDAVERQQEVDRVAVVGLLVADALFVVVAKQPRQVRLLRA